MYALHDLGRTAGVDEVRASLEDNPRLSEYVLILQAAGVVKGRCRERLNDLLPAFRKRQLAPQLGELRGKLSNIPSRGPVPVDLLKELQAATVDDVS
jgi:hypothetical protein